MPDGAMTNEAPLFAAGLGLFIIVLGVLCLAAVIAMRPRLRLKRRMEAYGLAGGGGRLQDARLGNPRQKRIQEKLNDLQDKGNKKQSRRNQIRADLLQAGVDMNVRNYLIVSVIVGLVATSLMMLFEFPILAAAAAGVVGTVGLPKAALRFMAGRRRKKFTAGFADAIDVVVRGVKSGLPVGECQSIVGREVPDPVGEEFRLMVEGEKIGITLEEVMRRALERMPSAEFKFFAVVLQIQRQTGGNLAETLENLSGVLRDRKKMKDKVRSMSSEARASAMIIGSLPFGVACIVSVVNPGYLAPLFTETTGQIMVVGGLVWMGMGVASMAKMISFNM